MAKYRVSDTVTYARSWIVDARSVDDAIMQAVTNGPPDDASYEAEQIDNTPYEAERVRESKRVIG